MSIRTGIMVIQMTVGFGALTIGLWLGGADNLWWLAIVGGVSYFVGMVLPFGLKGA